MADENDLNINIGSNPAGVESGSRRAKTAVNSVTKEARDLDAALRRLRSAIDPTFAATDRYNKALADAEKLLAANRIGQDEFRAATAAARAELDAQVQAIQRNSAASRSATEDQKRRKAEETQAARAAAQAQATAARQAAQAAIAAAREERAEKARLEAQERAAIRLSAQLARQAALEAARTARPVSQRAIGNVAPGSVDSGKSIAQLQYNIARAQGMLERLSSEAEAAAARAAAASSASIAASAQALAQRRVAAAQETRDRIIEMERDIASQEGALAQAAEAEQKAARAGEIAAAKEASAAAVSAAKAKREADRNATQAAREAAQAVAAQARADREAAEAVTEFRASLDPAFAAQNRYNQTMQRATALLMENRLAQGEWNAIQRQAAAQMSINTRSLGRMNSVNVQLGYQMQDVAASIASGINPLVILAQQGGQTASALSMLGGRAGAVASILGGIWVQAGLAAVLVLYQLFKANKEAHKSTLDLTDAESVRAAKLPELIEKVKEFAKEQTNANNTERANLGIKASAIAVDKADAYKKYADQLNVVNSLTRQLNELEKEPITDQGKAGAVGAVALALTNAKNKAADLKKVWDGFVKSDQELGITQALKDAQGEVDEMAQAQTRFAQTQQRITEAARRTYDWINKHVALQDQAAAKDKARLLAQQLYLKALQQEKAEEKAISDLKKQGNQERASFAMPVSGPITSGFGARQAPLKADGTRGSVNHAGIDIGVPVGTSVKAPQVGVVEAVGFSPEMGKYIILSHGGGTTTRYLHLSDTEGAQKGQHVEQGQEFAKSGNTGGVRAHLHYEVRVNGKPVDPTKGIFPIDTLKAEQAGFKELETAGQKAANAAVEAVDTSIRKIQDDTSLSNEEQARQVAALEDRRIAILKAAYGQDSKQYQEALQAKESMRRRYAELELREAIALLKHRTDLEQAQVEASSAVQGQKLGQKADVTDFKESTGLITERQAVIERAAILDQEYAQQVAFENRMYELKVQEAEAERDLPGQTLARQREINAELETAQAIHLGKMQEMQAGYARNVAQINNQQATVTLQRWKTVTDAFTGGLQQAFQGLWTRSTSVSQALLNLADQEVYALADMGIQALNRMMTQFIAQHVLKQGLKTADTATTVASEATKTAAVMGGEAARTGAVVAGGATKTAVTAGVTAAAVGGEAVQTAAAIGGAGTRTAVGATAAAAQVTQNAAVAAAGAFSSTVVIPFIGPVAAPVAAALALATVLGFGALISAKGGMGEVPNDQMAMVHKKEMILPAWIAEPLRASLKSPGRDSGPVFGAASAAGSSARSQTNNNRKTDVNFNYQPQHTHQPAGLEDLLNRDGATMRKWVKNQVRNGSLTFGSKS